MSVLPLFFGFLLGAAIGTIATASTFSQLINQARSSVQEARWRMLAAQKFWRNGGWLSGALHLRQVEILVLLIAIWSFGLFCEIFATPAWDHNSYIQYILGTLVGMATAPWIWLHFSPNLQSSESAGDGASSGGELARYRFMTYTLGAVLLVALLRPYLAVWLPRTNKIEGFGVALNFVQVRTERGSAIPPAGQANPNLGATSSRLARATSLAHLVATGHQKSKPGSNRVALGDVKADMDGFSDLSVIDRDKVYIAYFNHERNAARGLKTYEREFSQLNDYVQASFININQGVDIALNQGVDIAFLQQTSDLSECISLYAENLRDFRLFLVDSQALLRELLVNIATHWGPASDAFVAPELVAKRPTNSVVNLNVDRLADEIVKALKNPFFGIKQDLCSDASKLAMRGVPIDVKGIGTTPYPAYFIAHYLAAIDSVESGVLVLRDWLNYQNKQLQNGVRKDSPAEGWYTVRAMLTSSQLPYRFGSVSPTHQATVKFQQLTTDRIAGLLGIRDARTWQALCKRLTANGLHARIGRYLALTYADERNYLFELLRPEDFGLPLPGERALVSTNISPLTYIEEADAILSAPECFSGVPRFERQRELIGQYYLNVAQLKYAARMLNDAEGRSNWTRQIRADLERAKQLETDQVKDDVLDLLRQSDEFEPQRTRLARFRKLLDSESESD